MTAAHRVLVTTCVATFGFAVALVASSTGALPIVRYCPVEHLWTLAAAGCSIKMELYGRMLIAGTAATFAASASYAGLAWARCAPGPRALAALTVATVGAIVLALVVLAR